MLLMGVLPSQLLSNQFFSDDQQCSETQVTGFLIFFALLGEDLRERNEVLNFPRFEYLKIRDQNEFVFL